MIQLLCDGCHAPIETDGRKEFGYAKKTIYCDECQVSVEKYLEARDDLHTKLAMHWAETIQTFKDGWRENHPNGMLPDE